MGVVAGSEGSGGLSQLSHEKVKEGVVRQMTNSWSFVQGLELKGSGPIKPVGNEAEGEYGV